VSCSVWLETCLRGFEDRGAALELINVALRSQGYLPPRGLCVSQWKPAAAPSKPWLAARRPFHPSSFIKAFCHHLSHFLYYVDVPRLLLETRYCGLPNTRYFGDSHHRRYAAHALFDQRWLSVVIEIDTPINRAANYLQPFIPYASASLETIRSPSLDA
jgi:hypothetical protein